MAARIGFDIGSDTVKIVIIGENNTINSLPILSIKGQPMLRVKEALEKVTEFISDMDVKCAVTGSGASTLKDIIGSDIVHEPNALAAAIDYLYPDVRTVIEMGRESQKYLLFERDSMSGDVYKRQP